MIFVGTMIVGRFVDDFGNEVYPWKLPFVAYQARYYFFKGE